jgi:hypothetical protein
MLLQRTFVAQGKACKCGFSTGELAFSGEDDVQRRTSKETADKARKNKEFGWKSIGRMFEVHKRQPY